jgi:hypothetical protein
VANAATSSERLGTYTNNNKQAALSPTDNLGRGQTLAPSADTAISSESRETLLTRTRSKSVSEDHHAALLSPARLPQLIPARDESKKSRRTSHSSHAKHSKHGGDKLSPSLSTTRSSGTGSATEEGSGELGLTSLHRVAFRDIPYVLIPISVSFTCYFM